MNELLEHENMQVRTFVNGTLYSLFSRSAIREQAKVDKNSKKCLLIYKKGHRNARYFKVLDGKLGWKI